MTQWDHSSRKEFYDYYAAESKKTETIQRFTALRDAVLRIIATQGRSHSPLEVADIGCGAGAQCILWAELGHKVHGLDVNAPLLELAKERTAQAGYQIDFHIGSASNLPWADNSIDVCLVPELLEHVTEWKACLREFVRILQPQGVLLITTTNKLCPVQQEFNLPLYSWYPRALKHYYEHLAATTRPALVNFAKYPAVNWFSFYSLRTELRVMGCRSLDRFDIMDLAAKSAVSQSLVSAIRKFPFLRFVAHILTPSTIAVAIKEQQSIPLPSTPK